MPEAADYLAGFGLVLGSRHGDWRITYVHAEHIQLKRWWIYEYPVTVTFEYIGIGTPNFTELNAWFPQFVHQERIMHTEAGNPWLCTLGNITSTTTDKTVTFTGRGEADRISERPRGQRDPSKRYAVDYPSADALLKDYIPH